MSGTGKTLVRLLGLLLISPPACGQPTSEPRAQLDSLLARLPHATFEWVTAEGVSDRAAMRVPVDLAGTRGWLQFDTGLDVTLLYGDLAVRQGWEEHEGMYQVPSFDLGGISLGPTWVRLSEDARGGDGMLGSLGLDLLAGRLVLIDYPGRRLALLSPGAAPRWLWQRTTWTPAELRDAKLFLTVTLGGETLSGIFFDTGTSAFEITVDLGTWTSLTGCAGPEDATSRFAVTSWGKEITALGCVARGPLVIGSAKIENPRVYYLPEQPNFFAGWPFRAGGLVGNAPFWDHVVVVDLGLRPRFGFV